MSYTPFARWRNFTLENLKSMLGLYPDMLTKMSRDAVADSIEDIFPGYKRTAYQFGCQLGIESRAEYFSKQNYLYFLSDEGLKNYLGFWFKMYVCPNPYVNSSDPAICPFQVIAKKVLEAPDHKISYTNFCDEAFGEGKSIDIFKNALTAWGKPLKVVGDEISIAPDKVEDLEKILQKVEVTLPMQNNKDVDEFFSRFTCEKFMAFYDLTTIDTYSNSKNMDSPKKDEVDIFSGFEPWLTSYNNPDYTGKQKYAGYSKAIVKLVEFMYSNNLIEDDDLNDKNLEKYTSWVEIYEGSNEAKDFDVNKNSNKAGSAALKKYVKYIRYLITPHVVDFDYSTTKNTSINKIFYGVPGCGKSYHIQHKILGSTPYIRTTFYQDYSNTDFVGQILPKVVKGENGEKDTVEYIFNPGPFTLALIKAISNPTDKIALVIEEINRGNAPAIFGDIFQLLDRDDDSISEYGIKNVGMIDYLNAYEFTVGGEKKRYHFDEIKIPGNLDIYATMNTSDQNVYTLDTAFTRRWSKEHIPNEFNGHKIEKMYVPGMESYTWGEFVKSVNGQIRDNLESLQVNEDKQVGAFFVKEKDLLENSADSTEQKAKMFAYKVLEYLWADVSKLDHQVIFNPKYTTFEDIVKDFAKGVVVFNDKLGFKTTVAPVAEAE